MFLKRILGVLALVATATPAVAMPTKQFVSRWEVASRISKDQARTMTRDQIAQSPELATLAGEFGSAAQKYKESMAKSRAEGQPRSCPPTSVALTIDDVVTDIRRLPASWMSREFDASFAAVMDRRYPCQQHNAG